MPAPHVAVIAAALAGQTADELTRQAIFNGALEIASFVVPALVAAAIAGAIFVVVRSRREPGTSAAQGGSLAHVERHEWQPAPPPGPPRHAPTPGDTTTPSPIGHADSMPGDAAPPDVT